MAAEDKKFDLIFSIDEDACKRSMEKSGEAWIPIKGGKGMKNQKSQGKVPLIDVLREEGKKKINFMFLAVDSSLKKSGTKSFTLYMRCIHNQKLTLSTPQSDFSPDGGTIWTIKFHCEECSEEKKSKKTSQNKKQKEQKSSVKVSAAKKFKMSTVPLYPAPSSTHSSELRTKAIQFGEQMLVKAAATINLSVNRILTADMGGDRAFINLLNEAPNIGILVAAALSHSAAVEKQKLGLAQSSASIRNDKAMMSQFKWMGSGHNGSDTDDNDDSEDVNDSSSEDIEHEKTDTDNTKDIEHEEADTGMEQ